MTQPPAPPLIGNNGSSTRPYLIRALHEWCTDNGFTPYIAVFVGPQVRVPMEYVKNGEIVLNVGFEATTALELGNERIEFKARFGGSSREISVPVDHVIAIYARENGQGMAFPVPAGGATSGPTPAAQAQDAADRPGMVLHLATERDEPAPAAAPAGKKAPDPDAEPPTDPPPAAGRPALKRIK
ncbi:MAG: ClpXP protease specificity-enhancing factor [Burkholderiales bacterium PBB1]|nr:MAG: ClpXP protease specificity-enhancing factor [Burkholderiales bacterium PBB1]